MKRFLIAVVLVLLLTPAGFAREQSLLARVTVYWAAGGRGSDRWTRRHICSTGVRPAANSLWQQSDAARRDPARGRYRLGGGQPQSGAARRPDRAGTQRSRDRSVFRNETTGVELGGPKSLFHAGASFAAGFSHVTEIAASAIAASSGF
jgi:hypothetical protein